MVVNYPKRGMNFLAHSGGHCHPSSYSSSPSQQFQQCRGSNYLMRHSSSPPSPPSFHYNNCFRPHMTLPNNFCPSRQMCFQQQQQQQQQQQLQQLQLLLQKQQQFQLQRQNFLARQCQNCSRQAIMPMPNFHSPYNRKRSFRMRANRGDCDDY